jgi:hypothetical protein
MLANRQAELSRGGDAGLGVRISAAQEEAAS